MSKTMSVIVNPARRPNGHPLTVLDPRRGTPFPAGPFEFSESDLADPRIRRLLPPLSEGGVRGGRDGDLVPAPPAPRKATEKSAAAKKED